MRALYLIVISICIFFASCSSSTQLYSWYKYEDATYKYSKTPNDKLQKDVLGQYEKMIKSQREYRGIVPPGLYSEYGYMLCKMNRTTEGIEYLNKEITLYPESEVYISRIIKSFQK